LCYALAVASRQESQTKRARAQELLGLFAYHHDAPLVARALGVSMEALVGELEALKIRRRAFSLTRRTDAQMPMAAPVRGAKSGPPVRRRKAEGAPPAPSLPKRSERDQQELELKSLLAEVGPRRSALTSRLGGISEAALLARFRAAGLEREFALRERDLIRALYSRHRWREALVAEDLALPMARLRAVISERGLSAELDRLLDRIRREERGQKWPRQRIAQVLYRRDQLRELGLLEELEGEVAARTRVLWTKVRARPQPLDELRKALQLTTSDAVKLRELLDLR